MTDESPWAADDDLQDLSDLPEVVQQNVVHERPPDQTGIPRAMVRAHLDKAIAEGAELLRHLRTVRASLDE